MLNPERNKLIGYIINKIRNKFEKGIDTLSVKYSVSTPCLTNKKTEISQPIPNKMSPLLFSGFGLSNLTSGNIFFKKI